MELPGRGCEGEGATPLLESIGRRGCSVPKGLGVGGMRRGQTSRRREPKDPLPHCAAQTDVSGGD